MFFRKYWIPLSVFIVAIVGVSLYYLQTRPPKEPILIVKPVEYEKPPAKAPVVEQPEQVGHVHEDGTRHGEPHEPTAPSEVNESEISTFVSNAPQKKYTKESGNPLMFKGFPIDLSDFEATKAAMIENGNFYKANWDPYVFNSEVHRARVYIMNISSYVDSMLCFYTPEQREEIRALHFSFIDRSQEGDDRSLAR